jgi:sec-independent protein translocase protein TatC
MSAPFAHITSHLDELRNRLIVSFLAVTCCTVVAYIFSEQITRLFIAPLFRAHPAMAKLVYTNLPEAFIAYIKVSLLIGLIVSFPVVLYQVWMFAAPGLLDHEKKIVRKTVLWATLLFASGAGFAYFIVLPQALSFFMGFAGSQLKAMPKLGGYLTFVARTSLAFGLAFEIPFLMVVATRTGLAPAGYFKKKRKYSYIAILVLSVLLTAGDLFAAVLLFLPLLGLYEAGLVAIKAFSSPA